MTRSAPRRNDVLKQQHEIAAARRLVEWLSINDGAACDVLGHGDPPAPDIILSHGSEKIGLEITTAYYNERDAHLRWGPARGETRPAGSAFVNPDSQLRDSVQRNLVDKSRKTYDFDGPLWLLIDVRPALTLEEEIDALLPTLNIPATRFAIIFLGVDLPVATGNPSPNAGTYHVWRLHPR